MPSVTPRVNETQARALVLRALRLARQSYRKADTLGEKYEREIGRLIARKTRVNSNSIVTALRIYKEYNQAVDSGQAALAEAANAISRF